MSGTRGRAVSARPWWLAGLFVAVFALFTDDYIIAGILPEVAAGVGVGLPAAGQLVSVASLTVAVTTPVAGVLLARVDRRVLVLAALALFVLANGLASTTESYGVLMALRVLAAVASAACLPAIFAAAAELAPEARRGRYLAVLSVAVTGAIAAGVSLGAWIATARSWSATFAAMSALGVGAAVLVVATFPRTTPGPPVPLREQARVLASRPVSAALAGGAIAVAGAMVLLTYLAPYLEAVLGRGDVRAPVFALFGLAATVGVFGGGWSVDRFGAERTLVGGMSAFVVLMLVFTGLAALAPVPLPLFLPLVVLWGALAYWSATAVQVRLHALAGPLTAQALAVNSSAGTLGVSAGAALGGLVVAPDGAALLPLGAGLGSAVGLGLLLVAFRRGPAAEGDEVPTSIGTDDPGSTP